MSSTTATTSAPRPVEAGAKPAQAGTRPQDRKTEGGDIFASLLSLLASVEVPPPVAALASAEPADTTASDKDTPDGSGNPLAALMGWGLPGAALGPLATDQGAERNIGLPGAAWSADRSGNATTTAVATSASTITANATLPASTEGKIDISGMTAVEPTPLEIAPKGAVALPANAVRPGAPMLSSARTLDAAPGQASGTPWRQAPLASTETLAIQQSANQIAQVRSTVALNERFGATPGVPLATTELREAASEGLSLPAATTGTGRASEATTAQPAAVPGDGGATGSDSSGANAGSFDQTDGQPQNPFADANPADEPTVTHWGNHHLRHASLSVGGEGGDQAIDIQLSMKGQELQVEFKTDNAEARASLREHAGDSLADLLNKSGIQLGGVSVGAQGERGARGDAAPARQSGVRGVAPIASASSPTPVRPTPANPRADGSQPLDVFA